MDTMQKILAVDDNEDILEVLKLIPAARVKISGLDYE